MVIALLLLVCNINVNEVCILTCSLGVNLTLDIWTHLDVMHLSQLLLIRDLRLLLPVVESAVNLLPPVFDLLAGSVILALHLLEIGICAVSFFLQLSRILGVMFAQFFISGSKLFERLSQIGDELGGEAFMLGGAILESG